MRFGWSSIVDPGRSTWSFQREGSWALEIGLKLKLKFFRFSISSIFSFWFEEGDTRYSVERGVWKFLRLIDGGLPGCFVSDGNLESAGVNKICSAASWILMIRFYHPINASTDTSNAFPFLSSTTTTFTLVLLLRPVRLTRLTFVLEVNSSFRDFSTRGI